MPSGFSNLAEWFTIAGGSFVLIFLAEIGDKTQLVCMTLAARYRGWPVFIGSVLSFLLLNVLAVVFGAALAHWVPERVMLLVVAALFALFGVQFLRDNGEVEDAQADAKKGGRSILLTTFVLIFVAELGDKTQIAVAGLAGTAPPLPVWVGATLALTLSSGLGVLMGRTLLQRIPLKLLNRVSGVFFLLLALLALVKAVSLLS